MKKYLIKIIITLPILFGIIAYFYELYENKFFNLFYNDTNNNIKANNINKSVYTQNDSISNEYKVNLTNDDMLNTIDVNIVHLINENNEQDKYEINTHIIELQQLNITYSTCLDLTRDLNNNVIRPVRWLHIPKCGTTFGSTILYYACENIPKNSPLFMSRGMLLPDPNYKIQSNKSCKGSFTSSLYPKKMQSIPGSHAPVNYLYDKGKIISLFREPKSRVISAFWDGKHSIGMPEIEKNKLMQTISPYIKGKHRDYLTAIQIFADWPGISSCQTKMILGYDCAYNITLNENDINEAIRRLKNEFLFVGIVEHWNASICLFHKMLGNSNNINIKEFDHIRTHRTVLFERDIYLEENYYRINDLIKLNDRADEIIYQTAKDIFFENYKKYFNISI